MIIDNRVLRKLNTIEARYEALRFEKISEAPVEMCEVREHFRQEPKLKYKSAPAGTKWGGEWMTAWFRGDIRLPKQGHGKKVFVRARTGGVETLFLVDGKHCGVFDHFHPVVMMTLKGVGGQKYHLSFEAYSGHLVPGCSPNENAAPQKLRSRTFDGIELLLEREEVSAFVFDVRVLRQVMNSLEANSLRRNKIMDCLMKVYASIDAMPEETEEADWRPKLAQARKLMRPLLEAKNGTTAPFIGLTGHSHIDTAWLWPLAETWRKCGRTFSSVLNLMEQYPEFTFLQSAPCHADVTRREYPGIFKRMQQMVKAGRWEPNGGMWIEADCNIPSGESFIRQFLVGQKATRAMFGYTSDVLWMPDVFGYSGALPQILRGCEIEFFCTTKLSWSDTTRFPYDMFIWKGIDGTSVLTHLNNMHCRPDPETLTAQWNKVPHKNMQDRVYTAFGFGDGGGGPMAEMIEVARRVGDLEGCPRTGYVSLSKFMQGVRDELTDLPVWLGELYLEYHRGTLTSIAKIKRGNRKVEFALREAEILSTLAALRGAQYPSARFEDLWKETLTNQFHDILPGSSIAEVNDEAIASFEHCIAGAKELTQAALSKLARTRSNGAGSLLVANTLGWERKGEMALEGIPVGRYPDCLGVRAQWIEDVEGKKKLILEGLNIPAFGSVVVPLKRAAPAGESPFKVSPKRIDAPHAVIRFDKAGRMISFIDKASGRELVKPGGALNTLLIGEDIPEAWDNWDIDADQSMKMHEEQRLVKREVVSNGPLQLRLRSTYKIGLNSTMVQDMVLHVGSAQVDFESVIDWAEKHKLLKAKFALDIRTDFARHEIQYGYIERPNHRNLPQDQAKFEVCAHKWTDLSETEFGVALLNDCKYGVSVLEGEVGLSLMKSGTHPDMRGDAGRHLFTYSLLPHACGFSVESVVRPAYELNVPPLAKMVGDGVKPFHGPVEVEAKNVIVECLKWAEKGNAFIVRLYEAGKTGGKVKVKFNMALAAVSETNMLEEKPRKLRLNRNAVSLYMKPFEIKTLYCEI